MTESQTTLHNTGPQTKKVPIQERSFMMGNFTGVNGYRVNRTKLKQRFAEGGYEVHETEHFLLLTRSAAPTTILVHWFRPEAIDADIGDSFMQELKPLGVLAHAQDFGDVFGSVVFSLFPHDAQRALHLYGTNTLRRYQQMVQSARGEFFPSFSTINAFAAVYQRVFQLHVGESFLDVGCSFGFLPLLISQHFPALTHVVGVDIQTDPFTVVRSIAEEQQLKNVHFCQADVLADTFSAVGHFDTVVALHVLEHLNEAQMYRALLNLLKVTSRRLIIAVPYEDGKPEKIYGHEQLFTREKLEAVGDWCLQQLEGSGKVSYEDCAGGFALIEKTSSLFHDTMEQSR